MRYLSNLLKATVTIGLLSTTTGCLESTVELPITNSHIIITETNGKYHVEAVYTTSLAQYPTLIIEGDNPWEAEILGLITTSDTLEVKLNNSLYPRIDIKDLQNVKRYHPKH